MSGGSTILRMGFVHVGIIGEQLLKAGHLFATHKRNSQDAHSHCLREYAVELCIY